jgi:hypothetical protein
LEETSFVYLSRYPTPYEEPNNPETLLIYLIETITKNIQRKNIEILQTKSLRFIVSGGVDDGIDLVLEGL